MSYNGKGSSGIFGGGFSGQQFAGRPQFACHNIVMGGTNYSGKAESRIIKSLSQTGKAPEWAILGKPMPPNTKS
jgi:hypothetical protein